MSDLLERVRRAQGWRKVRPFRSDDPWLWTHENLPSGSFLAAPPPLTLDDYDRMLRELAEEAGSTVQIVHSAMLTSVKRSPRDGGGAWQQRTDGWIEAVAEAWLACEENKNAD